MEWSLTFTFVFFWLLFLFFKILLIVSRNMYLCSHCLFLFSWQLNLHLHFPKPHFYVTHISYIIHTNAAYALGRVLWIKSRVDRIRKCDEKGTLNTESIPRFEVKHVEELSAILFILFGYQNLFHYFIFFYGLERSELKSQGWKNCLSLWMWCFCVTHSLYSHDLNFTEWVNLFWFYAIYMYM